MSEIRLLKRKGSRSKWDNLAWKDVDVSGVDLGEFDDSVFFGLEEVIDYSSAASQGTSISDSVGRDMHGNESKSVLDSKEETKRKKQKVEKKRPNTPESSIIKTVNSVKQVIDVTSSWNGVSLHSLLVDGLTKLKFVSPTPIQSNSISVILNGKYDIVGSAETGSGKTLAFALPILHSLLFSWEKVKDSLSPLAYILAPTRELAIQISSVLADVCNTFKSTGRFVNVVNIVGGLSEQKQRRQLCSKRAVHVLVATPGRLCELLKDPDIQAFRDMSQIRYLVVDEADRMMEDGHFPELSTIFARIRKHEAFRMRGEDPLEATLREQKGTEEGREEGAEGGGPGGDGAGESGQAQGLVMTLGGVKLLRMPSEDELRSGAFAGECSHTTGDILARIAPPPLSRQTLLYSATSINSNVITSAPSIGERKGKEKDKKQVLRQLALQGLPSGLQQLLSEVGVQKDVKIVTSANSSVNSSAGLPKGGAGQAGKEPSAGASSSEIKSSPLLPQGLTQLEVRSPSDEKDVLVYYFISQNIGRTLLFVNSIKTARRVDGLLRALGINCRTIHSQLQQKQRLKAMESFSASPIGVLVATDVASRGLDIPRVEYVVHYDVARSPQVYIHRSGRTARAGAAGTTLSVVSPEDSEYHRAICSNQSVSSFKVMSADVAVLQKLVERVKLAKKIFLQSFVSSQELKQKSWLQQTAKEADLEIDEDTTKYIGDSYNKTKNHNISKKELDRERKRLRAMLEDEAAITSTKHMKATGQSAIFANSNVYRKKPFVVFAK